MNSNILKVILFCCVILILYCFYENINSKGKKYEIQENYFNAPSNISKRRLISPGTSVQKFAGVIIPCGRAVLWGYNLTGLLGYDSFETPINTPSCIPSYQYINTTLKIAQVVGDDYCTAWLTTDGNVFCTGYNKYGQLGIGDSPKTDKTVPHQTHVIGATYGEQYKVKQIHCCHYLFVALLESGDVYAWGSTEHNSPSGGVSGNIPTRTSIRNKIEIYGSSIGIFYIEKDNRKLYVCGYDDYGQLGVGKDRNFNQKSPIGPELVNIVGSQHNKNVTKISCADYSTIFLLENGDVYSCGSNIHGSLGIGLGNSSKTIYSDPMFTFFSDNGKIVDILATGIGTMYAKTESGDIYSCGNNDHGLLGIGNTENQSGALKKLDIPDGIDIVQMVGYGLTNVYMVSSENNIYHIGTPEGTYGISEDTHTEPTLIDMQITAPLIYDEIPQWNPPPNNFGTPVVIPLTIERKSVKDGIGVVMESYYEITASFDELPYYTHPSYPYKYYRSFFIEYTDTSNNKTKPLLFTILYSEDKIYLAHQITSRFQQPNETKKTFQSPNTHSDGDKYSYRIYHGSTQGVARIYPNYYEKSYYYKVNTGSAGGKPSPISKWNSIKEAILTEYQVEIDADILENL